MRRIMKHHYGLMKEFRELEFTRKLKKVRETRIKVYENVKINEGDLLYYQHQDKMAWMGLVRVFVAKGNDVFIFANGSVRTIPRCNDQLCEAEKSELKNEEPNVEAEKEGKVRFEEQNLGKILEMKM